MVNSCSICPVGSAGRGVRGTGPCIEAYAHGSPSFLFPAFYVANFSIPREIPNPSQDNSQCQASTAHLVIQ